MAQDKKTSKKPSLVFNGLAIACLVALIILSGSLIVYTQQNASLKDKINQITGLQNQLTEQTPKLISIDFQYSNNASGTNAAFLQVTGYVANVGNAEANNCTIHVTALQGGNVTAIDTSATINSLAAGDYQEISVQFPYTGQPLVAFTSYLTWTN